MGSLATLAMLGRGFAVTRDSTRWGWRRLRRGWVGGDMGVEEMPLAVWTGKGKLRGHWRRASG